eukprot:3187149-Rhodomonas_salina.1
MPSQLSRAHDARQRPDPLLGVAQMLKWLESASGTDLLQTALAAGKAHQAQICCKRPLPLAACPSEAATLAPTCPHSFPEHIVTHMTRVGDQIRCLAWHKC